MATVNLIIPRAVASDYGMDTDLGNVDASFWGENANDRSGHHVAGAGDVNGDGCDDILICTRDNDDGGSNAGQTYLIFGKGTGWTMDIDLSRADASFWGEDPGDHSGDSAIGVGDVNGDGYSDFVINAMHDDDGGLNAGQTYLIFGKASGWAMDTNLSNADASFWGENADDALGRGTAGAGDVNGDGYDDILIGAPNNDDGANCAGKTYLVFGKAWRWSMDTSLSNADASFHGEYANDYSGYTLAGAGDVNGDGYDDILIGAFRNDESGVDAGQTYLILGKARGWARDTNLSNADASYWGEEADDYFGYRIDGAGDVNGDGYDDFLIVSCNNDEGGSDAGQTYLILGKAHGWAMDTDLSATDASFIGESAGDRSGCSVAGAGDVNGDGFDDILIGAQYHDWGGSDTGHTYLILGKATGWATDTHLPWADASFWGEDMDDQSGSSVAGAGDVNGDGHDDILIGALSNDDGGIDAGQTYLIFYEISSKPLAIVEHVSSTSAYDTETITFKGNSTSELPLLEVEWSSDRDGVIANTDEFSTSDLSVGVHKISYRVMNDQFVWSNPAVVQVEVINQVLEAPGWEVGDCWRWEFSLEDVSGKIETMIVIEEIRQLITMRGGVECIEINMTYAIEGEGAKGTIWLDREDLTLRDHEMYGLDDPLGAFMFWEVIWFPIDVSEGNRAFDTSFVGDMQIGSHNYSCVNFSSGLMELSLTYSPEARHIVTLYMNFEGETVTITMQEAFDKEAVYNLSFLEPDPGNGDGNEDGNGGSGSGGDKGEGLDTTVLMAVAIVLIMVVIVGVFVVARRRWPTEPGVPDPVAPVTAPPLGAAPPPVAAPPPAPYAPPGSASPPAAAPPATYAPPGMAQPSPCATAPPAGIPSPPIHLSGYAEGSVVYLIWMPPINDGGNSIKRYMVYRGYSREIVMEIGSAGTERSYVDKDVQPGATYYYAMKVETDGGRSEFSNVIEVVVPGP